MNRRERCAVPSALKMFLRTFSDGYKPSAIRRYASLSTLRALICLSVILLVSCTSGPKDAKRVDSLPPIYPDYVGVTIPVGIAPMNFDLVGVDYTRVDVMVKGSKGGELHYAGGQIDFPLDEWHKLTGENRGGQLSFTVSAKQGGEWVEYKSFDMKVSENDLDAWGVTYRRIAPGYEVYGHMGIYQRELSSFAETAIIDNRQVPGACFNCHTPNRTDPQDFTFHIRGDHGGTYVRYKMGEGEEDELLQAVNDSVGGSLVYPYWHPTGRYCAYSTNATRQGFHAVRSERLEVFDQSSDVLLYEPTNHTILRDSMLATADHYETYPVFAPDGLSMYFCSSEARSIPEGYKDIKYNICRVAFDPERGEFVGKVDTIFNARAAGKSAIHPRPSYDGQWLMFTLADYGCFPIWHKEADNYLLNLSTMEAEAMTRANSGESDSFHNWSRDSHWVVFTSRRDDGLYSRLYLTEIDAQGHATKAFLLPQRHPKAFYDNMLYSYNTPDFTLREVQLSKRKTAHSILSSLREMTKLKNIVHRNDTIF